MEYDCEIEGCFNKTNYYLCEYHQREASREDVKITYCRRCYKILNIAPRKVGIEASYESVEICIRCKDIIDSEFNKLFR